MSLSAAARARRGGRVVLDNTDPAIPLDRVPYFLGDLRRVLIVGVLMVILLLLGQFLIPLVVK
jgi:hypothetical protein